MGEQLYSLGRALLSFVEATETQSQGHIKPLHWHIAERLVIEGGFPPDDVNPRPPLRVERSRKGSASLCRLVYDPDVAQPREQTLLGGLKTKQVDVFVSKKDIGPCLAVSVKGSLNAFRNLTNRMEEAAGDCTNLHIAYPTMVYGFLHFVRANREGEVRSRNDIAIHSTGMVAAGIMRYHDAMARLAGRMDVRDDVSRYEAVALALVELTRSTEGGISPVYPPADSPLNFERFFQKLCDAYDLRFVYAAPALEGRTKRLVWAPDSPAVETAVAAGFTPRLGSSE